MRRSSRALSSVKSGECRKAPHCLQSPAAPPILLSQDATSSERASNCACITTHAARASAATSTEGVVSRLPCVFTHAHAKMCMLGGGGGGGAAHKWPESQQACRKRLPADPSQCTKYQRKDMSSANIDTVIEMNTQISQLEEAVACRSTAVLVVLLRDLAQPHGIDDGVLAAPSGGRRQLRHLSPPGLATHFQNGFTATTS